jgi:hypothetical protein
VVGESPSAYRERTLATQRVAGQYVPVCIEKTLRRPVMAPAQESSSGEAGPVAAL